MPELFNERGSTTNIVMKTSHKRISLLILATALAVVFTAGCGTVRGFGRDVETVGENIEESAR
jgi:predicted small secreted protein